MVAGKFQTYWDEMERPMYRQTSHWCVCMAVAITLIARVTVSHAQCSNSIATSCKVYDACFAKYCPCDGNPNEYFKSYGEKYCSSFLANVNFSDAGKAWRDSTLRCLQEAIVPELDISDSPKCDCAKMKAFAFKSHVDCYTSAGASICDLGNGDLAEIAKTVDAKDLLDHEGWKQMLQVAGKCAQTAPDDGRRASWLAIESMLKLR